VRNGVLRSFKRALGTERILERYGRLLGDVASSGEKWL
jgi:hypothetical protein